jgi:hypothetical protein
MPKLFTSIQNVSVVRSGGTSLPLLSMPETTNAAINIEQTATLCNPGQPCDTTDASSHSNASMQSYIKIETKSLSRACSRRCPCQCHIPLKATTPRWLQGFIGAAFVNFTGTPLLNHRSCDFKNCDNGSHASGSVRFSYLFPAWLLQMGIDFTASWRDVSGIGGSWSLRMPRLIDDVWIYSRFVAALENGSASDVRRLMITHGVRVFDEFPSFPMTSVLTASIMRKLDSSKSD